MKGKTKKIIRSIGKKILAISTSAVLAFTTVTSTMPTLIHANDNEIKIARDEVTNITVKSIASYDQYTDLEHLMDNDIDSYMDSDYSNHNNDNLQWYQFELNEEVNVSRVRIHPRKGSPNGRPNSYKIYAGTDADNLGLITEGSIDPTIEDWTDITFEPVTARFVKVELTTAEDNFLTYHVITAAEVELYKSETEPEQAVEEAYATEGYQDADGYVYLKLNGKPEKITSVGFVITEIDGEYYAVSDEPVSALTYGGVCLAGSTDKRIWSHFYVNEDGTVDVCTEYNLQNPTIYIKVGDERVNINTKEDYSITIPETFTDVPYVHVESVDISQVTVLHAIPSEEVLNIEVTGNHQSVDIPLINKSAQEPKSGLFAVSFHYASNGSKYFEITVNYDDSCVEARTTLDNTIKEAEALNETDYTAESWKTLQDAIAAGKEVADNNIATKDVITNASDTISTAIENLVEEVKVDKSKLEDMITKYGSFTSDHSTYSTFQKTLTQARNALDDSAVTQERVDYLTRNLEAHYYLVKVAELNSEYDYDTFDYSTYKTETITPVIRMLGTTRNKTNVQYFENAKNEGQMKGWYEEYQKAIEGLEKVTAEDKYVGFNPESDNVDQRQGNFSIINEEIVDGKTKITVRFDNDGLHPIYGESKDGKEFNKFSGGSMNELRVRIHYYNENFGSKGSFGLDGYEYIEGEENYYDGFIGYVTLKGSFEDSKYISLQFSDDNNETYAPWYYRIDDKVDKTELNELIKQCQELDSDYENYEILEKTLQEAIEINESSTATQEEVDNMMIKLEAHYYLVKVSELNSRYDYDTFDYSSYKTETVIPVIRMLGITRYRTNVNYSENAENKGQMKGWYEEYQKAIEGLQKATDEDKLIGFNPKSDSSNEYQGNFSIVSEEVVDGKIKLTVRFDNDGLHPIYGESRPNADGETEYEGFPPSAMTKPKATVYIWDENFELVSSSSFDEYQKFEGVNNFYKGFIATKEISNARAKYITFRYYEDSFTESQTPWYYKLDDVVDTSKLQTLVDEVANYERNTGVYKNEFKPAFEKAEEILSNQSSATQEEVDKAYATLDKAYARCQIQDYILDYYYRPYEKYADYTTDSALTLYHALGSAQTILDENTLTTDELKAYIKELDEKKAALVKVEEGTVKVEKGINKDAADNENNVGFFTVTEEANGDKVILHVEYHNDGINHLTNEELATLDFTNIKNYRIVIENRYYDKEENGSSSSTRNVNAEEFKPLNGETDYSKGFQFDYEVDPGNIKIRLKDLKQNEFIIYSLGTYLTDEEKNAPEALKIKKLDDGTVRVEFSEPVEIEDANWKKSDKAGERDGSVWIGTLTEDKFYEVAAKDLPGNSMTFTVDHKTPVVKSISYSETELTNKDVKVAINFDEYISVADTQLNPGWKYDVKHLKATKTFSENTTEDVTFVDKTGNKVTVTVTVNNIDKTVPEVEVSYSNDNGNQVTRDDVTVTLTANEAIKDIEGLERTSENVLTKVFSENGKYSVDVYDLAGNMTTVNFEVKRIDRIDPVITLHGVEPDGITKDKVTYTISEQSISKIVIDGVEYNEKNAPKEITGVGKHTIRVIDKAGNGASISFTIVESVNPTVTVKDSSKGTEGHYSYLDLKLYDASGIDYVVVNGVEKDLTNNAWSDLNDANVNYVEGHNVVEVYDIYGNKTVFEFDYDTVAPEVMVKDSSKGTDGYYSYLDLKLHDNKAIDYVVVNGVEKDLANNAWSDLNDANANYVEGHNIVEIYDIYGNKTVFDFDYDTTAPIIFAENITIKKGSTFDPLQGVKATDDGKDITSSIVVEANNVNTRRTGKYEVRYSVTDLAGNTTEKTIIVTVEKKSCLENIVDIVEDTIKVVEDIVHGILDWIF